MVSSGTSWTLNRLFGISNPNSKFITAVANARHCTPDIALNGVLDNERYRWQAYLDKRKGEESQWTLLAFTEGEQLQVPKPVR